MKSRIVGTLFALPFLGVGLWMSWSIGSSLLDAYRILYWQPASAEVLSGGYRTNTGDSTTWEAHAEYRYFYEGREYVGQRVGLSSGADNIGKHQRELGSRLQRAAATGSHITVYVNPDTPAEAIVDRDVRWGLLGFKGMFLLVFGGIGLGILIAALRSGKNDSASQDPEHGDKPWLQNPDWQASGIRSTSRSSMWAAWFFAGIWCLVSSPIPFIMKSEVLEKGNHIALVALLFPLVGIGLLIWAIRLTMEWRRFGLAPVVLDPFPGAIGGHVGGKIELALPFDPAARFEVSLTSLHSYVSGSGKNRSRREKASWQDTRLAHAEPGSRGTRLTFRFDVPEGLKPSDANQNSDSYQLWRLHLHAEVDGPDLDRSYNLPVFPTGARSRVAERGARVAASRQEAFDREKLLQRFQFSQSPAGAKLFYAMGRNLGSGLAGLLTGLVFAAIGVFVLFEKDGTIIGGVFTAVGGLIALISFYMTFNSLEVRKEGNDLLSIRRILGIPVKRRRMAAAAIHRLEKSSNMQTRSGGRHTILYRIKAVDQQGQSMTLGDGFRGESEVRAAMRFMTSSFGLRLANTEPDDNPASEDNPLAAD